MDNHGENLPHLQWNQQIERWTEVPNAESQEVVDSNNLSQTEKRKNRKRNHEIISRMATNQRVNVGLF